jgi:glycosyltransferase involved in cell wall biosynthesis
MARILQYPGSGMQRLLMGLLEGIAETRCPHEIVLLLEPDQSLPASLHSNQFIPVRIGPRIAGSVGRLCWDHIAVGCVCKKLGVDALYAPAHVRPAYAPCPVTVSVFDMMYHLFPRYWRWSDQIYFRLAVSILTSRAANIAALSENTKRDILSLLPVSEDKVKVVYPGVTKGFRPLPPHVSEEVRRRYELPRRFILYVGSHHPRKNLLGLLEAYERVADKLPHDLLIVGSRWSNEDVFLRSQRSLCTKRIRFVGFVPDSDLPLFYNEADLFVFPSLYEGFGFPVLEAMACGCPTIAAGTSSLPEVAGKGALLVTPGSVTELCSTIHRVLSDAELSAELRERALEQARRFSWAAAASETLALLVDAAEQGRHR